MRPVRVRVGWVVKGDERVGRPWALVWLCHWSCEAMAIVVGRVYVGIVSGFSGVVWWGVVSVVIIALRMECRSNVPPLGLRSLAKVSILSVAARMALAW